MKSFTFSVGGGRRNAPIDFGPCKAGTSTVVEVLFSSTLSVSINVSISNLPRYIDAVPKQFVLNPSSKMNVKLTWVSKDTKFQILNETLNVESQKSVQHLVLLGLATEKEINMFFAASNEKLYFRIIGRPETFFIQSSIFADIDKAETFIAHNALAQKGVDQFALLEDRTVYDKMLQHGSDILNSFTNSLLHTSYLAGYEIFQAKFLREILPNILATAHKKYSQAIPAIRRKVTFRGDISAALDQQCRSLLALALESIDGAIFRLVCDCLYRPNPNLAALFDLPHLNVANLLFKLQQSEIIRKLFYKGSTELQNRALSIEDQRANRMKNCNLFTLILCFIDLSLIIYKASGILRPLQHHVENAKSTGKRTSMVQARTLTEFLNSYYTIIGSTGALSTILNDLGYAWFNQSTEQPHPISPISSPLKNENIANFRTLLPHLLLYMSREREYCLDALRLPADTYEDIIENMRALILFCWPNTLALEVSKGLHNNLASLPSLTKTRLNKIILTIIKENQMAGLLCSEKVFLACLNSTVETSMISISCQQILKRLRYIFNPSNSPIIRTVDRMYNEFKRKQESLTRSSAMLNNANVLDAIISGSKLHSSVTGRKQPTLLTTLERHLNSHKYTEFLLIALQMIALMHGYDLNGAIFDPRDCVHNGLLLIMIARAILPTGKRTFPGKSLWKFDFSGTLQSSMVLSTYSDSDPYGNDDISDPENQVGYSGINDSSNSKFGRFSYTPSITISEKEPTLSQIIMQHQEREGYVKPQQDVVRLTDFYSCHLAFLSALECYEELLQKWDYSLYLEVFSNRYSILHVLPSFVYCDNIREQKRYSFSLFRLIDAYTRSMGSDIPNTSMLSYYVSILFITALVSNDYCLTGDMKVELLNVSPDERDYQNLLSKYAKKTEQYRIRTRVDRRIAMIQASCRGFLIRQHYRHIRYSALVIQHMWRTKLYQIERGYLLTAQARRNLYLRTLLTNESRLVDDVFNTEPGKRVLRATLTIQRYVRHVNLKRLMPTIKIYVATKRRTLATKVTIQAVRTLQNYITRRSLISFFNLLAEAEHIFKLSWSDIKLFLPTAVRGSLSLAESCNLLELQTDIGADKSSNINRFTNLGFSKQYLNKGPYLSISQSKAQFRNYISLINNLGSVFRAAYSGYVVRRTLAVMLNRASSYPRRNINHKQSIFYSARWMQYHPADVLQVLISHKYSLENREYVLSAYVAEYHGLLSCILLIQAYFRGTKERLRSKILQAVINETLKPAYFQNSNKAFYMFILREATRSVTVLESEAQSKLGKRLTIHQYIQMITVFMDTFLLRVSKIQGAFRGCKLRTALYRIRCACCDDSILMRFAIANGFNYYVLVDAEMIILRYMRGHRQRSLIAKAIQNASSAVKLFITEKVVQNMHTLTDFNAFQDRLVYAATIVQSTTRMIITTRNINYVMTITPVLLRYPIVCDSLLLPTTIFREIMFKHIIYNTVRLQCYARGYGVRLRQQLLHVLIEEMLDGMQLLSSRCIVASQLKHLVARRLDLAVCNPEEILNYINTISTSTIIIQAYIRGWKGRKNYTDCILVSVQRIQRAIRKYLQRLFLTLSQNYNTVFSDLPLLVSLGIVSQDIEEKLHNNVSYLSIINLTILQTAFEKFSRVLACFRGTVVRLRERKIRDISKTQYIFKLIWYHAYSYGQLPPTITSTVEIYGLLNDQVTVIQAYMRRRLVQLRVDLVQTLSKEVLGSQMQSQTFAPVFLKKTVLCSALQTGFTDAVILDAFIMTINHITIIQQTIRRKLFIKHINLLKNVHLELSCLSALPFNMVIQFFKNVASDNLLWTVRSSRRSVATMYAISKSLERIQLHAFNYLNHRIQGLCARLKLDHVVHNLIYDPNIRSSSTLERKYKDLDKATRIIQAWFRGYMTRRLVSVCKTTLQTKCGVVDVQLQNLLLEHLFKNEGKIDGIDTAIHQLLNAAKCIQRYYRGWCVRHTLMITDPSLVQLLLTNKSLKTTIAYTGFYNNLLRSVYIIQTYVRRYLHAQFSNSLDQINLLLQNDGTVNLIDYLSCNAANRSSSRISIEGLWKSAHSLKRCIIYIQALIRGFLVRTSILSFRSLSIYFGFNEIYPDLLLKLVRQAGTLLFNNASILYHPSRIESSLKWIKVSCNTILNQFIIHQKGNTIRLLIGFDLPTRCYMHKYITTVDPRLILKPSKCTDIAAQLVRSAIVIQSIYKGHTTRKTLKSILLHCSGDTILAQVLFNNIFISPLGSSSNTSFKNRCTVLVSSTAEIAEKALYKATVMIQRAFRFKIKNKRMERAQFYGEWNFFSKELESRYAFRQRELELLCAASTIQRYYRQRSLLTHLTKYTGGDTLLVSIFLRELQRQQQSNTFNNILTHKQLLTNIQLIDNSLSSATITIQTTCRKYIVQQIYPLLHQCVDIGIYSWMVLNCLATEVGSKLTRTRILDAIGSVCTRIVCIQAYVRGYKQRNFSTIAAANYTMLLTKYEKLSGPCVVSRVCGVIDNAEKVISASIKSYLIRNRLNYLRKYSAMPSPHQINDILTVRAKFERYLGIALASLTIQRYSRGFLAVCSLRQAVSQGIQLYLPHALMTAPSKCALLTSIIIDLIVHIQTSARRYLIFKSIEYIKKHLDKKLFSMCFTPLDLRHPSLVLGKIQLILSSASLISIKGRAFITRKTYKYVQKSGLLNILPINFTYSCYSRTVKQIEELFRSIVFIQAGARGFFVRHKIRIMKEAVLVYGGVLDQVLMQLIWERTVPNHFNSVVRYYDSQYDRLHTHNATNSALPVSDAVALIAHAAILIQKYFRGYAASMAASLCKKFGMCFTWNVDQGFGRSVTIIQAVIRGWCTRTMFARMDTWERDFFLFKSAHLHFHCPSHLDIFRTEIYEAALTLGSVCRGFIIRLDAKAFKHNLGKIRHKPTRRAFKNTLNSLNNHLNIKIAVQEVARFSAALHLQSYYRGNRERAKIQQRTWRKIQHIHERIVNSLAHGDKTKTVAKQILIHKAILFKADHPHNNPRSVTKLNYFCNLYSPSAEYIFSRDFCDIIMDVIGATITTPVLQQYNVFRDGCCLITKMLTYNTVTFQFDTLNLTNFQELIKAPSPKMQNAPTKALNLYAHVNINTTTKPSLMRLPDILINAIDFNKEDKEICVDAEKLLRTIVQCAAQIGYDNSYFISEYEKLEELCSVGLLKDFL